MRANRKKILANMMALTVSTMMASEIVYADEKKIEEEGFDEVIVTAQKYEKRDVDIAATTEILSEKDLRNTGASNVQQALQFATGITYQSMGPGGASLGNMTAKVHIRGVDGGTLVLVNGTPLNLRGLYNLEDIPVENVARIEFVRGGGSILYGSEATGGVINIITKKELQNTVKTGFGSYGQQTNAFTVQEGNLGLGYTYEKWGNVDKISSSVSEMKEKNNSFKGSEKNNVFLNYKFNDQVDLHINHNASIERFQYQFGAGYDAAGNAQYDRKHKMVKDFVQINFKNDADVSGNIYYNENNLHSTGIDYYASSGKKKATPESYDKEEKNRTYGYDVQKSWELKQGKILLGTTYQNESFREDLSTSDKYQRNNYSVYTQWENMLNDKDTLILSARETWTTAAPRGEDGEDKNYDNFSGQGQWLHKLKPDESVYASIGQSFKMPTFKQMYAAGSYNVIGDDQLRPQKGTHYEIGWKKNSDAHKWKVALFEYHIKDNITYSKGKSAGDTVFYAINEDLKNTGIEINCEIEEENGWSYQYGLTYGNPKSRSKSSKVGTKEYWDRTFGKLQLNGGVGYHKDKWAANLNASYLSERVMSPSDAHSFETKPYLLTNFNLRYAANEQQEVTLSVNNILDRQDNVSHTSSYYYTTPINYMLTYQYKY
ncbi:TonB-dependent receptor plug domain-containing protein [Anaerosinus massiliensis]|uniref:TonB-dependent receptor plug domain-containing protein n=1 Tax=Massilibacillus massiliensis TaxID=1806837 RepID=UPI000DA5F8FF|nr:TonB-dependent receptor [Massilibacillus massiliensis]